MNIETPAAVTSHATAVLKSGSFILIFSSNEFDRRPITVGILLPDGSLPRQSPTISDACGETAYFSIVARSNGAASTDIASVGDIRDVQGEAPSIFDIVHGSVEQDIFRNFECIERVGI